MQTTFPASEPKCSMCMNLNKDPVYPVDCGHCLCKSCTRRFIEKTMICPVCHKENLSRGNQPVGCMTWRSESYSSLPGYEKFGTIVLTFNFDSGIQGIIKLILLAIPFACIFIKRKCSEISTKAWPRSKFNLTLFRVYREVFMSFYDSFLVQSCPIGMV